MMRRGFALFSVLAAVLAFGACASTGGMSGGDRNVLTADQISAIGVSTAYDAVERLRPQWLRRLQQRSLAGGGGSPDVGSEDVVVYVDGVRSGGRDALKQVRADAVYQMRYLDASQATAEYGTGHLYGAIDVKTKSGAKRGS